MQRRQITNFSTNFYELYVCRKVRELITNFMQVRDSEVIMMMRMMMHVIQWVIFAELLPSSLCLADTSVSSLLSIESSTTTHSDATSSAAAAAANDVV